MTTASILVADDDLVARDLLVEVLVREGYRVRAAGSGAEAIRLAETEVFDLALVAEELGLEERLRQRRAVDGHERALRAGARVVDRAGHQLLARAGLPLDEHGGLGRGHARHQAVDRHHRR